MIYAYARVSTTDQNLDRQLEAFKKYDVDKIYSEKKSGKNFEDRTEYQKLRRKLKSNDLLMILSIDRLGRNYEEILSEWRYITTEKKCDVQVLDTPILNTQNGVGGLDGKFISNLILQILAYTSQKERENIKKRQAEGIKIAKEKGIKLGRPKFNLPNNFEEVAMQYLNNEIDNIQACKILGMARGTFFRYLHEKGYGLKNDFCRINAN